MTATISPLTHADHEAVTRLLDDAVGAGSWSLERADESVSFVARGDGDRSAWSSPASPPRTRRSQPTRVRPARRRTCRAAMAHRHRQLADMQHAPAIAVAAWRH